jgi:UDP-GlcNAc3NAcA epimerase
MKAMKKILTVIGARPQIIKAAAFSRAIAAVGHGEIEEVIVHTGQHYDEKMSQVFFDEMGIPAPKHNLEVGSGSHATQTARMLESLERVLREENPDGVLVYGDTNSTLAAALAASKLFIPVIHVEAGLRSFNKRMPEEINRIATDHVSTILFAPTQTAIKNLQREGFDVDAAGIPSIDKPLIVKCGDVMYDNAMYFQGRPEGQEYLNRLGLNNQRFVLATVHRDNNTDSPERLNAILEALAVVADKNSMSVVLPSHPRLLSRLTEAEQQAWTARGLQFLAPASYVQMVALLGAATLVCTDSGGLQKEAYFMQKPCVIMRSETEWVELVEHGHAIVADANTQRIVEAADKLIQHSPQQWPLLYGDGHAAEHICKIIQEQL